MTGSPTFTVFSGAVPQEGCASWLRTIAAAGVFPGAGVSVRADAVADLSVLDLSVLGVWSSLSADAQAWCANELGPVAIDLDQCWVRRQPGRERPHPHSWHQDGALGFDFLAPGAIGDEGALLRMVTCWIALTPCGLDAPGLELVTASPGRMLAPLELRDEAVDAAWPGEQRLCPQLSAGDAVLFTGGVLHRTQVAGGMDRERTSIELRCFAAGHVPSRLAGDRFVEVE